METPLSVVCWLWQPREKYRSVFKAEHVNILHSMVSRHYKFPFRFICVTDMPDGIGDGVEIIPLWQEHGELRNPHGSEHPSCYRRLRAFSAEAEQLFGPRFVSLDLDCVVTADLTPLWHRKEDFVIWGDTNPQTPYNGSMFLMTAGARRKVWDEFDPHKSPEIARRKGYFGSDQAWIGACLGPNEARWRKDDGVFSYRNQIDPFGGALPAGARIVFFHGHIDPWTPGLADRLPWIKQHYR